MLEKMSLMIRYKINLIVFGRKIFPLICNPIYESEEWRIKTNIQIDW